MYKIYHFLFGWDYIIHLQKANLKTNYKFCRLHKTVSGTIFFYDYYGDLKIINLQNMHSESLIWVTCNPKKYIRNHEK